MKSADVVHIVVLACAAAVVAYATGAWALVAVPTLICLYVATIYRRCPFRTELILLSLFSAHFMLVYTGICSLPLFASASEWHLPSRSVAGLLFVLPLVAVGAFVISALRSRPSASVGGMAARGIKLSSGNLAVALLLAPAWAFAAALAWQAWK